MNDIFLKMFVIAILLLIFSKLLDLFCLFKAQYKFKKAESIEDILQLANSNNKIKTHIWIGTRKDDKKPVIWIKKPKFAAIKVPIKKHFVYDAEKVLKYALANQIPFRYNGIYYTLVRSQDSESAPVTTYYYYERYQPQR